jgi:D-alanine-D-alanine ligase
MEYIAILTGGDSAEYEISLLSANTVLQHLNSELFKGYIVLLKANKFTVIVNNQSIAIDKTDFSFIYNNEKIKLEKVFMALHGPPAENGLIQPYFDNLNITYTSSDAAVSSLTFDKYKCNANLTKLGYRCAESYLYHKGSTIDKQLIIDIVQLPCFVKPNGAGSSFGITKVKEVNELVTAIDNALLHDNKVLIEQFINGTEVSCGVFFDGEQMKSLPITEIVSENEFFDYQAKYEGKSKEITPARINSAITLKIQNTTINIYKKMRLRGVCRIDYIIMNDIPYIIEINTIPGLSEESIIPQQLKSAKLRLDKIFEISLLNTK